MAEDKGFYLRAAGLVLALSVYAIVIAWWSSAIDTNLGNLESRFERHLVDHPKKVEIENLESRIERHLDGHPEKVEAMVNVLSGEVNTLRELVRRLEQRFIRLCASRAGECY